MLSAVAVGEIIVAGPHVLLGYLGGIGDDTNVRVDGCRWHRTRDAGWPDHEGRLWLVGRCTARIANQRGVLYPFSVEAAQSMREDLSRTAFLLPRGQEAPRRGQATLGRSGARRIRPSVPWAYVDDVIVVERIPWTDGTTRRSTSQR